MSEKKLEDGGRAFPRSVCVSPIGDVIEGSDGMSLRDWFAGMALQGFIARSKAFPGSDTIDEYTDLAFEFADGMVERREEK